LPKFYLVKTVGSIRERLGGDPLACGEGLSAIQTGEFMPLRGYSLERGSNNKD
jgi:hypothetical protein